MAISEDPYIVAQQALGSIKTEQCLLQVFRCACSHGHALEAGQLTFPLFKQFCTDIGIHHTRQQLSTVARLNANGESGAGGLRMWSPYDRELPLTHHLHFKNRLHLKDKTEDHSSDDEGRHTSSDDGSDGEADHSGPEDDERFKQQREEELRLLHQAAQRKAGAQFQQDQERAARLKKINEEIDKKLPRVPLGSGLRARRDDFVSAHLAMEKQLHIFDMEGLPTSVEVAPPKDFMLSNAQLDHLYKMASNRKDYLGMLSWTASMVLVSELLYPDIHKQSAMRSLQLLIRDFLIPYTDHQMVSGLSLPRDIPYDLYPTVRQLVFYFDKPIARLFDHYSKLKQSPGKDEAPPLYFEGLLRLFEDAAVFPKMLTHADVYTLVEQYDTSQLSEPSLDVNAFTDALVQASFMCFARAAHAEKLPTIAAKLQCFFDLLRPLYKRLFGVPLIDDCELAIKGLPELRSLRPESGPNSGGYDIHITGHAFSLKGVFIRFGDVVVQATTATENAVTVPLPPQPTNDFDVHVFARDDVWHCEVVHQCKVAVEGSNDGEHFTTASDLWFTYEDREEPFNFSLIQTKLLQLFTHYTTRGDPFNTKYMYRGKWQKFKKELKVKELRLLHSSDGQEIADANDPFFFELAHFHEDDEQRELALSFKSFLKVLVKCFVSRGKLFPLEHIVRLTERDRWMVGGHWGGRKGEATFRALTTLNTTLQHMNLTTNGPGHFPTPNLTPRPDGGIPKLPPYSIPGTMLNGGQMDHLATSYFLERKKEQAVYLFEKWQDKEELDPKDARRIRRHLLQAVNGPTNRFTRSHSLSSMPSYAVTKALTDSQPLRLPERTSASTSTGPQSVVSPVRDVPSPVAASRTLSPDPDAMLSMLDGTISNQDPLLKAKSELQNLMLKFKDDRINHVLRREAMLQTKLRKRVQELTQALRERDKNLATKTREIEEAQRRFEELQTIEFELRRDKELLERAQQQGNYQDFLTLRKKRDESNKESALAKEQHIAELTAALAQSEGKLRDMTSVALKQQEALDEQVEIIASLDTQIQLAQLKLEANKGAEEQLAQIINQSANTSDKKRFRTVVQKARLAYQEKQKRLAFKLGQAANKLKNLLEEAKAMGTLHGVDEAARLRIRFEREQEALKEHFQALFAQIAQGSSVDDVMARLSMWDGKVIKETVPPVGGKEQPPDAKTATSPRLADPAKQTTTAHSSPQREAQPSAGPAADDRRRSRMPRRSTREREDREDWPPADDNPESPETGEFSNSNIGAGRNVRSPSLSSDGVPGSSQSSRAARPPRAEGRNRSSSRREQNGADSDYNAGSEPESLASSARTAGPRSGSGVLHPTSGGMPLDRPLERAIGVARKPSLASLAQSVTSKMKENKERAALISSLAAEGEKAKQELSKQTTKVQQLERMVESLQQSLSAANQKVPTVMSPPPAPMGGLLGPAHNLGLQHPPRDPKDARMMAQLQEQTSKLTAELEEKDKELRLVEIEFDEVRDEMTQHVAELQDKVKALQAKLLQLEEAPASDIGDLSDLPRMSIVDSEAGTEPASEPGTIKPPLNRKAFLQVEDQKRRAHSVSRARQSIAWLIESKARLESLLHHDPASPLSSLAVPVPESVAVTPGTGNAPPEIPNSPNAQAAESRAGSRLSIAAALGLGNGLPSEDQMQVLAARATIRRATKCRTALLAGMAHIKEKLKELRAVLKKEVTMWGLAMQAGNVQFGVLLQRQLALIISNAVTAAAIGAPRSGSGLTISSVNTPRTTRSSSRKTSASAYSSNSSESETPASRASRQHTAANTPQNSQPGTRHGSAHVSPKHHHHHGHDHQTHHHQEQENVHTVDHTHHRNHHYHGEGDEVSAELVAPATPEQSTLEQTESTLGPDDSSAKGDAEAEEAKDKPTEGHHHAAKEEKPKQKRKERDKDKEKSAGKHPSRGKNRTSSPKSTKGKAKHTDAQLPELNKHSTKPQGAHQSSVPSTTAGSLGPWSATYTHADPESHPTGVPSLTLPSLFGPSEHGGQHRNSWSAVASSTIYGAHPQTLDGTAPFEVAQPSIPADLQYTQQLFGVPPYFSEPLVPTSTVATSPHTGALATNWTQTLPYAGAAGFPSVLADMPLDYGTVPATVEELQLVERLIFLRRQAVQRYLEAHMQNGRNQTAALPPLGGFLPSTLLGNDPASVIRHDAALYRAGSPVSDDGATSPSGAERKRNRVRIGGGVEYTLPDVPSTPSTLDADQTKFAMEFASPDKVELRPTLPAVNLRPQLDAAAMQAAKELGQAPSTGTFSPIYQTDPTTRALLAQNRGQFRPLGLLQRRDSDIEKIRTEGLSFGGNSSVVPLAISGARAERRAFATAIDVEEDAAHDLMIRGRDSPAPPAAPFLTPEQKAERKRELARLMQRPVSELAMSTTSSLGAQSLQLSVGSPVPPESPPARSEVELRAIREAKEHAVAALHENLARSPYAAKSWNPVQRQPSVETILPFPGETKKKKKVEDLTPSIARPASCEPSAAFRATAGTPVHFNASLPAPSSVLNQSRAEMPHSSQGQGPKPKKRRQNL
eukprot:TRINITY_DN803_c0_g1_i1.p1 TRINITY_DN803_c0_g1~~TRINITY_DN803_c0_g1_i1.p1  ORF type:complete len:2539 (+),score=403.34 TRINITY_DN803_c0_g1_i1:1334-8950(+)